MSAEFDQCISEWADRVAERDKEIAQLQARLTASEQGVAWNGKLYLGQNAIIHQFEYGLHLWRLLERCIEDLRQWQQTYPVAATRCEDLLDGKSTRQIIQEAEEALKHEDFKPATPSPARRWTREKPTEPGNYWLRLTDNRWICTSPVEDWCVVEVWEDEGRLVCSVCESEPLSNFNCGFTEWSGPIPAPAEEA